MNRSVHISSSFLSFPSSKTFLSLPKIKVNISRILILLPSDLNSININIHNDTIKTLISLIIIIKSMGKKVYFAAVLKYISLTGIIFMVERFER